MKRYTRKEVVRLLSVDDGFLVALESEGIVVSEDREGYSAAMLERIRVAQNLTRDLDVNLPGVAIILHMREEMARMRRRLEELADQLGAS